MNRTFLALAVCAAVGIGGMALARHDEKDTAKVTDLSRRDIVEKLDGKDARVTVEEVAIEPGGQVVRTATPARCSGTSWKASTSTPSTTTPSPPTRPGTRSTSRPGASTG